MDEEFYYDEETGEPISQEELDLYEPVAPTPTPIPESLSDYITNEDFADPPIPEEEEPEGPGFWRRALLNTSLVGSDILSGTLGLSKRLHEAAPEFLGGGRAPGIETALEGIDELRQQDLEELGSTSFAEDALRGVGTFLPNLIGGGGVLGLTAKDTAREYGRKYDELGQLGVPLPKARTGASIAAGGAALSSLPIFSAAKSGLPAIQKYTNAVLGGAAGGAVGSAADMAGTSVGTGKRFSQEEWGDSILRGIGQGAVTGAAFTGVSDLGAALKSKAKAIKDYSEVKKFEEFIVNEGSDTPEPFIPEPKPQEIVPDPIPEPEPIKKTVDVDMTQPTKTFEAPVATKVITEGTEVISPPKSKTLELPGKAIKAAAEIPGYLKSRMTGEIQDDRPPVEKFLAADTVLPEFLGKPLSTFRKQFTFLSTLADKGSTEAKLAVDTTRKLSQDQSSIVYDMRETLDPYFKLKDKSKVDRALAAERLVKKRFPNKHVTNETLFKMGLTPEEAAAYRSVRGAMDKSLSLMEEALLLEGRNISREIDNPNDPTAESPGLRYENEVKAYIDDLRSQGYVPFSRYGEGYIVRVEDGNKTAYSERFDNQRDAVLAAKELSKQYGRKITPQKIGRPDNTAYEMFGPDMSGALQYFDPDKWTKKAQDREPKGFSKHLVKANLTPGFELDLARPISDYVLGLANFVSHKKAKISFTEIINSLPENSQTRGFIQRFVNDLKKPSTGTQQIISFLNTYYLAGVPASAITNLTQTTTTTFPEFMKQLKGRGGFAKATAVLGDASTKAGQYMTTALTGKEAAFAKRHPDTHKMLKDFERRGIVDAKAMQDLVGYKNNLTGEAPLGQKLMFMFGGAEKFNRLTAAIGGYEIAKIKGLEGEAAYKFAEDLIYRTQFDQTKFNRPEIARGPIGRAAFQFKLFTGNYFRFLRNNMASGDYGAVAASLGAMATWGGILGIPFVKEVESLMNSMGIDVRKEFSKIFKDNRTASAFMYGLPTLTGANISGSAGTAEIIQGLDKSPESAVTKAFLGTGADLIFNKAAKAGEMVNRRGSYPKALAAETLLLPRFLRNPAKAARGLAMHGFESIDANSKLPVMPNPSLSESALLAAGVPPHRMIQDYQTNNSLYLEDQRQTKATGDYNKDIARALVTQDKKLLVDTLKAMEQQGIDDPTLKVEPNEAAIQKYIKMYKDPKAAAIKEAPVRGRGVVEEIINLRERP